MAADTVIGLFEQDQLPTALAGIHRAGYGPNARVLQGRQADVAERLKRAGISEPPRLHAESLPVLVVFAPMRVAHAADLMQTLGAREIHLATRDKSASPLETVRWKPKVPPSQVTTPPDALEPDSVEANS